MSFDFCIKLIVAGLLILFFVMRSRFTSHYKTFTYRTLVKYPIILGLLAVYLFGGFDFAEFYLSPLLRILLGFPIIGFGLALFFWAHLHLGRNWSPIIEKKFSKSRYLVTSGPYKFIRHPIYSASFITLLGLLILTANWIFAGSIFLILLAFYLHKLPKEEKELIRNFGAAYKKYMRETGGLLPKVFK